MRTPIFQYMFGVAIIGWLMSVALLAADELPQHPNVVILFADDLGYGELGCQGNAQIPTPFIDSIADGGVRFTDGYVTEPVCSPSRAGLVTGRYQHRFGYIFNVMPHVAGGTEHGLPRDEVTLGEYLQQCGYRTAVIGKWHLGAREDFNPIHNGFDEFFGFAHEGHFFVPPPYRGVSTMLRKKTLPGENMKPLGDGHAERWISTEGIIYHNLLGDEPLYDLHNPILRGTTVVEESEYLTDAFTREALQFIDRNRQRPFLLYVAYNAVHSPLQGADRYMHRFSHIEDIQRRIFAAMLSNLDDSVGKVLNKIRECDLTKKTIVFFLSDNGGPTLELTSSNVPLSGGKGSLLEGGIRVPFMVQWSGVIPAGEVYRHPVISLDIFATAAALAGRPTDSKTHDGVNLIPHLLGENPDPPHATLYWRRNRSEAIRSGDWKLLRLPAPKKSATDWKLFHLKDDIAEANDLARQYPQKVEQLQRIVEQYRTELAPR